MSEPRKSATVQATKGTGRNSSGLQFHAPTSSQKDPDDATPDAPSKLPPRSLLLLAMDLRGNADASGRFTCGFDTAGTAWCWDWNPLGQRGDGTLTDRRIPVAYRLR